MFGDGDLTLRTLKLWNTLESSGVLLEFADVCPGASSARHYAATLNPLISCGGEYRFNPIHDVIQNVFSMCTYGTNIVEIRLHHLLHVLHGSRLWG